MTEEQIREKEQAAAHLTAAVVNLIDRETELPDEDQRKVEAELDFQPGEPAPENDMCPRCGGRLEAAADPDSLLDYPMKYQWKCGCGYEETREDDFEFQEEEAIPEEA